MKQAVSPRLADEVDVSTNAIETLAEAVQRLHPSARWLHSQQDLLAAAGSGTVATRGRWSRIADRVAAAADTAHVIWPLVAVETALLLTAFCAMRGRAAPVQPRPTRLFVGLGALRDPVAIRQFADAYGQPDAIIDERSLAAFDNRMRLSAGELWREWRAIQSEFRRGAASQPGVSVPTRTQRLSHLLRMGFRYIYLRAWFRRFLAGPDASPVIGFSAASLVAYAAVAAGARAVYLPHGFQARGVAFPDFQEVVSFNRFDAEHIRKRLPNAVVKTLADAPRFLAPTRAVAVIGVNHGEETYDLCRSLITWTVARGLPVIVRPHPHDRSGYWDAWRGVDGVEYADDHCDFDTFLAQRRPGYVASWHSTVLYDAVVRGAVPITLDIDSHVTDDVVFPFQEVALRWPDERAVLEMLIDDEGAYARHVSDAYANVAARVA